MKIMGIDYGKSRIGCAVSDALGMIANPIGTVHETYFPKQVEKVAQWIREQQPEKIVVGLPRHMNGAEGDSAQMARDFAEALEQACGVPCIMRDERMTTVMAHKLLNTLDMRGSEKRKKVVDTVSAVYILQEYLDSVGKVGK